MKNLLKLEFCVHICPKLFRVRPLHVYLVKNHEAFYFKCKNLVLSSVKFHHKSQDK